MEWQPIETAPTDVIVHLGKWTLDYSDKLQWVERTGVAWECGFLGKRARNAYTPEFIWWKPLPGPPK